MATRVTAAVTGTTTLQELQKSAFEHRSMNSSFEWLKRIGLVPQDVKRMDQRQVLTDLDPNNISVAYIAASAYEFDQWGENSPVDFINAIAPEARGAKRDIIVETLMTLGGISVEA